MFRILLPSIVGGISFLIVVLVIYFIVARKLSDPSDKKIARTVLFGIIGTMFLAFGIYAFNMASVNSIPRSELDPSTSEEAQSNYQQSAEDAAKQPKDTTSTSKAFETK